MTPTELQSQPWQYLGTVGVVRDADGVPSLYVVGINGGDAFCTGLTINDNTVERLPGETWDELVARVRRDPILRGDPANIATAIYPGIEPKAVQARQLGRGR